MKPLKSVIGLAFFSRLLAVALLVDAGGVGFSNLAAQVQAPSATDVSPTVNTEVSSVINTGSGYDAWTGSAHRQITDLKVPGAVSSHGLKWTRTYNSANSRMWSYAYTWRYYGRGWPEPATAPLRRTGESGGNTNPA